MGGTSPFAHVAWVQWRMEHTNQNFGWHCAGDIRHLFSGTSFSDAGRTQERSGPGRGSKLSPCGTRQKHLGVKPIRIGACEHITSSYESFPSFTLCQLPFFSPATTFRNLQLRVG